MEADAEVLLDARAELAESPQWDAATDRLLWVDINPGVVHRLDPATGAADSMVIGPTVGAVAPTAAGGLVAAARDGFEVFGADGQQDHAVRVDGWAPGTRMNDGKCDPAGRFWAGSMVIAKDVAAGTLFRLDPDLSVMRMLDGVTVSNGMAWSADATRMYYIDSPAGGIDELRYDVDTGAISDRRRLISIASADGEPDGLTVDADGCLWVALWGGGQVRRYTPGGRLDAVVRLPVSLVTSCCFGGTALDVLHITTARSGLTPSELHDQPLAGGIFAVDVGTSGFAATPFASA